MGKVAAYLRPVTVEDAIESLRRPGAVVMGGGTKLNGDSSCEPVVLVDLQALSLDVVRETPEGALLIGATATLEQIAEDVRVPPAIRETARREEPSTLRTTATLGGCVASADPQSVLLATLLVHDTEVSFVNSGGKAAIALAELLADPGRLGGGIITGLTVETTGDTFVARTGRTVADRPIVAAVARRTATSHVLLALSGVAAAPILVPSAADALGDALSRLHAPADFRGSAEYRRALAAVLAKRVLEEVA